MESKSIWILNHHANINGHRHLELAREFAKQGYKVIVIASAFDHMQHKYMYDDDITEKEEENNVIYIWLHTNPTYQNNGVKRIINMFSYLWLVKKYAPTIWNRHGKPDYVIGSSVHPLAWEAAYWVSKRCKADFICEVRDFWPLSLIEISGVSKIHPSVLFFSILEKRAYKRAKKIVTTFPYGYKYICEEMGFPKDKVFWMPNGIRIDEVECEALPQELLDFLNSHWCCIYAGSFVQSECIEFMLEAFQHLKERPIYFAIVGNGHEADNIKRIIREKDLQHVNMFSCISKQQVMKALKMAKCCLAARHNHPIYRYGLSMNKLNDYLLSGTPVVFACDAPNVVEQTECITMPYGNEKLYADAIEMIYNMSEKELKGMGQSGKRIIESTYDFRVIAQNYINMLEGSR